MKTSNRIGMGVLLLAALAVAGCRGEQAGRENIERALMDADRAFARETAEQGIEGWMAALAPDVARLEMEGEVVRGLEAVREHDTGMFEDPSLRLEWEPTVAGGFETGDHGFTRGRYELVKDPDGPAREVVSRGTYLTVWRRDAEGWKVILDTGVPDTE